MNKQIEEKYPKTIGNNYDCVRARVINHFCKMSEITEDNVQEKIEISRSTLIRLRNEEKCIFRISPCLQLAVGICENEDDCYEVLYVCGYVKGINIPDVYMREITDMYERGYDVKERVHIIYNIS